MKLQVQQWLGHTLDPENYGWERLESQGYLSPKQGITAVCPKSILKLLCCNCAKGYSIKLCGCKKNGFKECTDVCNCRDCSNIASSVVQLTDYESDYESDED